MIQGCLLNSSLLLIVSSFRMWMTLNGGICGVTTILINLLRQFGEKSRRCLLLYVLNRRRLTEFYSRHVVNNYRNIREDEYFATKGL